MPKRNVPSGRQQFPAGARAALGPRTARVVDSLLAGPRGLTDLTAPSRDQLLAAFATEWADADAARVLEGYARLAADPGTAIDPYRLCDWVRSHPGDPAAVRACMSVLPPRGVTLRRLHS